MEEQEKQIERLIEVYNQLRGYYLALTQFIQLVAQDYEFHDYRNRIANLNQEHNRIQRLLLHISIAIKDLQEKT